VFGFSVGEADPAAGTTTTADESSPSTADEEDEIERLVRAIEGHSLNAGTGAGGGDGGGGAKRKTNKKDRGRRPELQEGEQQQQPTLRDDSEPGQSVVLGCLCALYVIKSHGRGALDGGLFVLDDEKTFPEPFAVSADSGRVRRPLTSAAEAM
jgi:hypothetical protein